MRAVVFAAAANLSVPVSVTTVVPGYGLLHGAHGGGLVHGPEHRLLRAVFFAAAPSVPGTNAVTSSDASA